MRERGYVKLGAALTRETAEKLDAQLDGDLQRPSAAESFASDLNRLNYSIDVNSPFILNEVLNSK